MPINQHVLVSRVMFTRQSTEQPYCLFNPCIWWIEFIVYTFCCFWCYIYICSLSNYIFTSRDTVQLYVIIIGVVSILHVICFPIDWSFTAAVIAFFNPQIYLKAIHVSQNHLDLFLVCFRLIFILRSWILLLSSVAQLHTG